MLLLLISGCKKHETYIVTFNANGGTGTMEAQTFTEGEAQALTCNAFTYDGYTFSGWNTVQSGSGASYTDGQTITATADLTLYAQWASNGTNPTPGQDPTPTPGQLNGHAYVDLGLPSGTLWATCNVGAETPEGHGNYYAWGETVEKEIYSIDTYTYSSTTLSPNADAATANWGSGWRMPTKTDFEELIDNCTTIWTTKNGVDGQVYTGNNGNSIFIPVTGQRRGSEFYFPEIGWYWSSSYSGNDVAWYFSMATSGTCLGCNNDFYFCYLGLTVRPVCMLIENN